MENEPQTELAPFFRGQKCAQVGFDFHRIVVTGEPEPSRESSDVRVDGQARQAESDAAQDVRRLTSDTGEGDEIIHLGRYLSAEPRHHRISHADEIASFGAEESR